jgi:hypothetical protein
LVFVTTLLCCFAAGIVVGDIYEDPARIAKFVGWASAVVIYVLGVNILLVASRHKCALMGFSILMMMVTYMAYLLEIFSPPIIDMLFHATSVSLVYLMYRRATGPCNIASDCKSKGCGLGKRFIP